MDLLFDFYSIIVIFVNKNQNLPYRIFINVKINYKKKILIIIMIWFDYFYI